MKTNIPTKFDQSDIDLFSSYFADYTGMSGWIIKINGKPVKLNSGKSLWKNLSHAKNALKGHFGNNPRVEYLPRKLNKKYLNEEYSRKENILWKNFIDFLQERGVLEFVELK